MTDLASARQAFRNGILRDADANTAAMLGSIHAGARVVDVPLVIKGALPALAVGDHVFFRLGLNGQVTILNWSMGATVAGVPTAGAVTVDVKAGSTLGTLGTICGTHPPALAATAEADDQAPAGDWFVQLADPQWIFATVTAADGTLEVVSLTLRCSVDSR